jgi:hypothetical protein
MIGMPPLWERASGGAERSGSPGIRSIAHAVTR